VRRWKELDAKLSAEHAPFLKQQLRNALSLLDDYDKTGNATSVYRAMKAYKGVLQAIGNRPPEQIEEMPRG
jgi:hypothetical protein